MWCAWSCKRGGGNEGFSLAESAIALAIVAAVIGAMVPAFLSVRSGEQARATRGTLETVMRASASYVQAHGCFPCPVSPALLNEGEGEFGVSSPCGSCAVSVGLVPFRSLGLPQSMARDGYGRYLTYAVDRDLTGANLQNMMCKTPTPPCNEEDVASHKLKLGLCQKTVGTNSLKVFSPDNPNLQPAALLVLSQGSNMRGAYRERGAGSPRVVVTPACALNSNGPERCNADDDLEFVDAMPTKDKDNPYDDQMLYFSRDALISYAGGKACDTPWEGGS